MWDTFVLGGNLRTNSEPFVGDVFLYYYYLYQVHPPCPGYRTVASGSPQQLFVCFVDQAVLSLGFLVKVGKTIIIVIDSTT